MSFQNMTPFVNLTFSWIWGEGLEQGTQKSTLRDVSMWIQMTSRGSQSVKRTSCWVCGPAFSTFLRKGCPAMNEMLHFLSSFFPPFITYEKYPSLLE